MAGSSWLHPLSLLIYAACAVGAPSGNALILQRDVTLVPAVNSSLPTNWTYIGCFNDTQNSRTLNGANFADSKNMNGSTCANYCASKNFIYAGTEFSDECWCDNLIGALASLQNDTSCSMACTGNSSEACGAANELTVYYANKAAPRGPTVNPGPPGWTSQGCWIDGQTRTLAHGTATPGGNSNLTVALCTSACAGAGYTLAGVEYAGECYCDNYVSKTATNTTLTDCNMPCNGNSSEFCGAGNRLNLYTSGTTTPTVKPVSKAPSTPVNWLSIGCISDASTRTLPNGVNVPGGSQNMTNGNCINACKAAGYSIAGTEYAGECWCGNSIANNAGTVTDGRCNMACNGNQNDVCGGSYGLTAFQFNGWNYQGCYTDAQQGRTLSYGVQVPGGGQNMSVEACTSACRSAGYTIAGVEYSGECYCDNQLRNGGGLAPDGEAQCNMQCSGNQAETCGGPNRLNLYTFNSKSLPTSVQPTSTTTPTPTSTTSVSATTVSSSPATAQTPTTPIVDGGNTATPSASTVAPSTSTSSATPTPSGVNQAAIAPYKYAGCYTDTGNGRSLTQQPAPDNNTMTVEYCVSICSKNGYALAGLQYSIQCFCDNYVHASPTKVDDSQCNMACAGNSAEFCGAGGRNSIYSNGTIANYVLPGPLTGSKLPTNWQYSGCYQDNVNNQRVFPYQLNFPTNNSNTQCIAMCQAFGYNAAGTEYADQCFCGDTSDLINSGAKKLDESSCFMRCRNDTDGSNGGEICGGGGSLSIYTFNGTTPLNQWTYATGNAAGAYQFLIGGVVIPLLTQPARNGKVVFMEKFGTEPANNSTGTYELDLTLINNFTAAWRPLHVSTDIFCSAGLTLPDRAGRQINVGGWSRPSTLGIRLYWPDGSPGVWGQNDWQENPDELHLLDSRWYPSAMMLANGSILVVGGEEGSNGAPTPTLEVLPTVNQQSQFCDYLNETDPYNLYPFLLVLPSGNVFVGYYNQAKLLDPVSLSPIKSLPQMPGAVNNPGAGRTYPMEGTMVVLPQSPPYTSLTVLVCGGSTTGAAVALDNCITMNPDDPTPSWTLERMPSKRVMPCIAALPDGTYLIANGAHQGNAGFGLATDPNLNAVLYDPSKPIGARMTMMANTTVARLYHSEAVLMDDGRVLISGSDPEDNTNPQEYRNEVFVPPYLMGNPSRPAYNLTNIDWSYGQSVTLSMSAPGAGGNYRVSLMGAVSSTHGNSMGQRTYLLSTSCSGSSCTVVAPPNANVCPPGWFQLFLLDGNGVPSMAQWVRVGGDPGQLGNWPDLPDFKRPGMGPVDRLF